MLWDGAVWLSGNGVVRADSSEGAATSAERLFQAEETACITSVGLGHGTFRGGLEV